MDVDEIPWRQLMSCAGSSDAAMIPAAIDLLFSECVMDRAQGYWGIDNYAVVQGDLYSVAPYAARMIVDRVHDGYFISEEVLNVLYELHQGSNLQVLEDGPLKGGVIETLCKSIVAETKPRLSKFRSSCPSELQQSLVDLLEVL